MGEISKKGGSLILCPLDIIPKKTQFSKFTPTGSNSEKDHFLNFVTSGDNSPKQAGIRFEQALAQLFYRSGWTQEQLAQEEGKNRTRITQMLQFGRFLNFVTTGNNLPKDQFSKLSERSFRHFWARTEPGGNERIRFLEVNRLF